MAVHRGDDQLADIPGPQLDGGGTESFDVPLTERVTTLGEIGPGAEGRRCAGHDDHPDVVVGVAPPVGIGELGPRLTVEGIAHIRSIEGDGGHAVVDLEENRRVARHVAHRSPRPLVTVPTIGAIGGMGEPTTGTTHRCATDPRGGPGRYIGAVEWTAVVR